MAGGSFLKSFEHDFELTASPSCSRRNSGDSDASWVSSLSSTLKGSNSLLSCSESELSVRTGSTAFKRLPPRPAPPPPPPAKPTNPRTTPQKVCSPLSVDTSAPSFSTLVPTERTSTPVRKKYITSKTLSLKKKPRLSRTLSSEMFTLPQAMSLPAEQISRTFSSDGVRHILYSLPPAYPPPPPPESPPLPPYAPMLPPTPPTSSTPTLQSTPPLPSSKRRMSPSSQHNISKSSVRTSTYHQYEDSQSNDHSSCHSDGQSNGRSCRPCLHKKSSLIVMSCISFSLSFACCFFTAYHFMYRTLDPQRLQICLPRDSFKTGNRLFEKLITKDKNQYCAKNNDEISDLIHAMFITLKTASESRNLTLPKYRPVSAHVLVQNETTDNKITEGLQRLVLSPAESHSAHARKVHANNVTVLRDTLNISISGRYFVYSSIYFQPRPDTTAAQVWKHAIVLKSASDGSDEALAETAHSCFNNCNRDIFTSYTGGIFLLQRHDLVCVNVTGKGVDVNDSEGSYLGLVMISGVP